MRNLGVAVSPSAGNPRVLGVIVGGTLDAPVLEAEFELRATNPSAAEQAVELALLLRAKLPGLTYDRAFIRVAGPTPVARRLKAPFSRAHAEGALLFVLREHSGHAVETGDPSSFAKRSGMSKDAFVALAKSVSTGKHEAGIAALGGFSAG